MLLDEEAIELLITAFVFMDDNQNGCIEREDITICLEFVVGVRVRPGVRLRAIV